VAEASGVGGAEFASGGCGAGALGGDAAVIWADGTGGNETPGGDGVCCATAGDGAGPGTVAGCDKAEAIETCGAVAVAVARAVCVDIAGGGVLNFGAGIAVGVACGAVGDDGSGGDGALACGCSPAGIVTCSGTDWTTGGNGICGAGVTLAGSCGVPTSASCGAGPATLTCSCNVVPAGSCCGSCAAITASPILSAVVPSGRRPITTASSTWPGLNRASSVAGRDVAPWASDCSGLIIRVSDTDSG
jgi:hypothetical protein